MPAADVKQCTHEILVSEDENLEYWTLVEVDEKRVDNWLKNTQVSVAFVGSGDSRNSVWVLVCGQCRLS